jgi:small subunit ribosomal protein S20
MANIKSARKRARQSARQRGRNASLRTTARSAIKQVTKAVAAGDKAAATAALVRLQSTVDRVAAKGVLHRGAASRHKSRLTRAVKAMA